ncbi:hypothetical protein VTN96DRAFT_2768 [Rasamsonia emersonii]
MTETVFTQLRKMTRGAVSRRTRTFFSKNHLTLYLLLSAEQQDASRNSQAIRMLINSDNKSFFARLLHLARISILTTQEHDPCKKLLHYMREFNNSASRTLLLTKLVRRQS